MTMPTTTPPTTQPAPAPAAAHPQFRWHFRVSAAGTGPGGLDEFQTLTVECYEEAFADHYLTFLLEDDIGHKCEARWGRGRLMIAPPDAVLCDYVFTPNDPTVRPATEAATLVRWQAGSETAGERAARLADDAEVLERSAALLARVRPDLLRPDARVN